MANKLLHSNLLNSMIFLVPLLLTGQDSREQPKIPVAEDRFLGNIRSATRLCVGQFEIVDFPKGNMAVTRSSVGARGTSWNFTIQFSGSARARFFIYDSATPREYGTDQCTSSESARDNAIVSGRIHDAVIQGTMLVRNDVILKISIPKLVKRGNRVVSGLSLLSSDLKPNPRSTIGGTIALSQTDLAIDNRDFEVYADDYTTATSELVALHRSAVSELRGALNINSPTATLSVSVGLKGDRSRRQTLDFKNDNGKRTDVRVDLGTGLTRLQNGQFSSGPFAPSSEKLPTDMILGRLKLAYDALSAQRISLVAATGQLSGSLREASVAVVSASYMSQPATDLVGGNSADIDVITVSPSEQAAGLDLEVTVFDRGRFVSKEIRVRSGPLTLKGPGGVAIDHADSTSISGSLAYESASVSGFSGNAETATFDAFKLSGRSSTNNYTGTITGRLNSLRIGTVAISSRDATVAGAFNGNGELAVNLKTTAPSDFAVIASSSSQSMLSAELVRCDISGIFSPAAGTFTVPARSLSLELQNLETNAARVLGGTPAFGAETLKLSNAGPVTLNATSVSGALAFASTSFSIKQPTLETTAKDSPLALGKELKATGSIGLVLPFNYGGILPASGTLSVDGIDISLPAGVPAVTIRASGLELELHSLKIGHIGVQLMFDVPTLTARADILVTDIGIGAGHVAHSGNPVFSGTATKPVQIESFAGSIEVSAAPLAFGGLAVHNASVTLRDITYVTPDAITFQSGTGEFTLEEMTEKQAKGNLKVLNSRVHASEAQSDATVQELSLQFTGTTAGPSASGTLSLGGLSFVSNTGMQIENCGSHYLPVRLSAQTGAMQGPVSMVNGQMNFLLASNDVQFQLFKDATLWQCEWDQKAGELSISYPCCDNWCGGFIKYPCDCHICTHKIADIMVRWQLSVTSLQASGMVTQIKLKPDPGKGIKPCEGHLTQLNPPVLGFHSIVPTIPGGNVGADIARAVIAASAAPFETAFSNSIGALGSLLSLTHIGDRFYLWGSCE